MLGPHCTKLDDPINQRLLALSEGWTVFQTHFAGPKSLNIPPLWTGCEHNQRPYWIWHAAYIAPLNTTDSCVARYLEGVIRAAEQYKIRAAVFHVGRHVGLRAEEVARGVYEFLMRYNLLDRLQRSEMQLAIELPAAQCDLTLRPEEFLAYFNGHPNIGLCLDLAHVHATGLPYQRLYELIENHPPIVCHANFPGSRLGSGQDSHGWRTAPQYEICGRSLRCRSITEIDVFVTRYDETVRLLKSKGVPLILEGSGLSGSDMNTELAKLREIIYE